MRVISLLPAATDVVVALGAADALVGVTHECDGLDETCRPDRVTATVIAEGPAGVVDARVRTLADLGRPLFTLDVDRITALRPDVVLTQALCDVCAVGETDVRSVAATLSPPPVVVTLGATTLDGVFLDIERVAAALGLAARGRSLIAGLRARLGAVHDRLRAAHAPRPRVAVLEWPDPVFAAGHWVPDMVHRAGGRDALAAPGAHSAIVTTQQVSRADPEVVIIAPCGYGVARAADAARTLLASADWRWAAARPVWALDANALTSRPGPHLVGGVETLAAALHPDLFAAPSPRDAVPVTAAAGLRDAPRPLARAGPPPVGPPAVSPAGPPAGPPAPPLARPS